MALSEKTLKIFWGKFIQSFIHCCYSVDLKWNAHVDEIVKKVNKRLYFLRQLKRAQVKSKELVLFYLTCIRSVMEYACTLFHSSLPQYLSVDLERCQKRSLRIMFPDKEYDEALACTGLLSLHERRENIADKLFSNALVPGHKLHKLLRPRNVSSCLLYTSPSPRDGLLSRMPSSA